MIVRVHVCACMCARTWRSEVSLGRLLSCSLSFPLCKRCLTKLRSQTGWPVSFRNFPVSVSSRLGFAHAQSLPGGRMLLDLLSREFWGSELGSPSVQAPY